MPEAVLSALLGLFGLYVAGVTFSLQQLSDRYSPRLLPHLQRRHVVPHLQALSGLLVLAGLLVALKAHTWTTGAALALLIAALGYALHLLPKGWGLASLDAHPGWLQPDDLTPAIVHDILSRLAQRRDGVTLSTLLHAVQGNYDLEEAVTRWLTDRPDLLTERWCGPVVVEAWTTGLTELNVARRQEVLIETVTRRLGPVFMPGASDLVIRVMSAVQASPEWGDDLSWFVLAFGQGLAVQTGTASLRPLTPELEDVLHWFEIKMGHLGYAALQRTAADAAWYAAVLGHVLEGVPVEGLIDTTRMWAEEPGLTGTWTPEMGAALLNGLNRAHQWQQQLPDRYPLGRHSDSPHPRVADPALTILDALRAVPMHAERRRYLAGKMHLGPAFRREAFAAIAVEDA